MREHESAGEVVAAMVALLVHAGALKRLRRQGWLHLGVFDAESVADHSYRVALMTLLMARTDPSVDADRALVLAICHDLPEAIAGDATPFDETLAEKEVDRDRLCQSRPVHSEEADRAKRHAEEAALNEMTSELPATLRDLIVNAWEGYEAGRTAEARLVRQVDKLEALLQATEYRKMTPDLRIESFELGARDRLEDVRLQRMLEAIISREPGSGEPHPS